MSGSATRNGPGDWADDNSPRTRDLLGRLRRMAVKLTSKPLWQVVGHLLLDDRIETRDLEVFSGIGFYARPKSSNRAEAIVAFIGGAGNPVAIATRDEDTRKKAAEGLGENETQMHNDNAVVRIKDDGSIEARTIGGTAVGLATKADLQVLRTAITNAVIAVGAGGAASIVAAADAALLALVPPSGPWPNGTKKFKAE